MGLSARDNKIRNSLIRYWPHILLPVILLYKDYNKGTVKDVI